MKSTKPVGHPVSTRSQENNELTYVNLILIVENCCSLKTLWYFPSAKSTSNMNVLNLKLCVGRSLASFSNLESKYEHYKDELTQLPCKRIVE